MILAASSSSPSRTQTQERVAHAALIEVAQDNEWPVVPEITVRTRFKRQDSACFNLHAWSSFPNSGHPAHTGRSRCRAFRAPVLARVCL
jgi:hypothetical protein